jgi:hypothetical protein
MPIGATALEQALATPAVTGQGMRELLLGFEMLAKRNSQKLKDSMEAFKAVKTPQDFMELQTKFLSEGMADALKDSTKIGELTKTALTAAFEPMRKKFADMQAGAKR